MTTAARSQRETGALSLTSSDENRSIQTEDHMAEPKKSEGTATSKAPEAALLDRLPATAKKFLLATGENDWPQLRLILCGCEPAGDLIELASEMNRAMQICPPIISTREWNGQLARGTGDKAYCRLHDAVHGVRQALHEILHLAGLLKVVQPRPAKPDGNSPAKQGAEPESVPEGPESQGSAGTNPKPATLSRKV